MGKVVVIGFDGATFDIIQPMLALGRLRNIGKLLSKGSSGNVTSTILPLSAPAWTSFADGRNPAKHGIYDFSKRDSHSYSSHPTTSLDNGSRTLWDYASEAGKRSLVVNVPLTYPPDRINGILISGFPYPENRKDFAYPKEVISEIKDQLGITSILKPNPQFLKDGDEFEVVNQLNNITRKQTEILKYFMKKEPWDLVVSVYDASDVIGHFFWHHIDPHHPKHDPRKAKMYAPLVYGLYEELDLALGEIMSCISNEDTLFLTSDHGFGPVYYCVYINNWLTKNNYLKLKRTLGTRFRKGLFNLGFTTQTLLNTVKIMHLVTTKTNTYDKDSKKLTLAKKFTLTTDDIDWNETLAYSTGNYGPIYVNLKGREPQGKVNRGEDYDNLVSEIAEKLKGFKDPETGKKVFDLIYTKDKIYSGAFYDSAPDILYFDSSWLNYPSRVFEFGSKKLIGPHPFYTGAHRMEGIFVGAGPEIVQQSNLNMYLVDIAPTIMHMLGLGVPSDMDGKVLLELFEPSGETRSKPIKTIDETASKKLKGIAQNLVKSGTRKI